MMGTIGRELKVFSGTAHPAFARRVCSELGIELSRAKHFRFSDGEIGLSIEESVRGADVFVVQPTCNPVNENLVELLIMIDALKRASAYRINVVIPYFGYARQDRKTKPRDPISAKLMANLLTEAGATRVISADLHAGQIQGFFDIPVDHLYAAPVIAGYIREKNLNNPMVVAPDIGGVKMVHGYSEMLGCELAVVAKQRKGAKDVETITVVGDVKGHDVVMIDDLTTTAGTLCSAAEVLKERGANNVYAAVSHAPLADFALERLKKSPIKELIVTDTVPMPDISGFPITVLSVSELLGQAISRIHNNESVTSLFRLQK